MVRAASTRSIAVTGEVLRWNEQPTEEREIPADQAEAFERDGYAVVELGGKLLAFKSLTPADGDITIQAKLDTHGRTALEGRHANLGYSGYFIGYVFLDGKRKALVDFRGLFPNGENRYAAQYTKAAAEAAVRQKIASLVGHEVVRVDRGFAFDPDLPPPPDESPH